MEVDVAVIGAGPAGSTLAALLAERGVSVALIDRDTFPRDKLCGEFLSYDALPLLDRLGVMGEIDQKAPRIERCRIVGSRRTYEFDFPTAARGISRMVLDDLLYRRAVAVGAQAVAATATAIGGSAEPWATDNPVSRRADRIVCATPAVQDEDIRADNPVSRRADRIVCATPAVQDEDIRAKVIAGAWGRWGRFDTQLGRAFVRDRSHRSFGFKRHYRGTREAGTIDLHSFARGYLGVNEVEDGITNICGLVHASRLAGHKGRWDSFVEQIRRERPALDALYAAHEPAQDGFLSSEPVIFRARSAVEGGVFMVGDASGVIDPLTGNGMAMAIQSAFLAAPHIVRALETKDRARVENDYRLQHHEAFAGRIAWSRRIARLLSRPRLLDAALAALPVRGIGTFLLRRTRAAGPERF